MKVTDNMPPMKSFEITSTKGDKTYEIRYTEDLQYFECSCKSFTYRIKCKHIDALRDFLENC